MSGKIKEIGIVVLTEEKQFFCDNRDGAPGCGYAEAVFSNSKEQHCPNCDQKMQKIKFRTILFCPKNKKHDQLNEGDKYCRHCGRELKQDYEIEIIDS